MTQPLIIQQPPAPQQLFLLFHGYGGAPQDLLPLGRALAQAFGQAAVVSVAGPQACAAGGGWQWFDAQGATDANRLARVAAALPGFVQTVRHWQQASGVAPQATALVGFSQGARMILEATKGAWPLAGATAAAGANAEAPTAAADFSTGTARATAAAKPEAHPTEPADGRSFLAGRVVALAGRYASLPEPHEAPSLLTTLHLMHGKADEVVPYAHTVAAAERLVALGADITADVLPGVGHEVAPEMQRLVLHRLQNHVPQRIWDEALRSAG